MTSLRPLLALALLATFVGGGVVLPGIHGAVHAAEAAAERAEHATTHHGESGIQAPCDPAPSHLDCAVCPGLTVALAETADGAAALETEREAWAVHAEAARTAAAFGAGARAPPIG